MSEFSVRDNAIKFNGRNYFRAGAQSAVLGAIGEKRSPLLKGNYLDPSDGVKEGAIRIRKTGPIEIDQQRSSKADFGVAFKALKLFDIGSAEVAWQRMVSRELVLTFVEAEERSLVKAINAKPRLLDSLRRWGRDARICHAVFVVQKAEIAKSFNVSHEAEAEFTVYGLTVKPELKVQQGGQSALSLPPESVLGYGMAVPEWESRNPKDGDRLVGYKPDWQGE